MRSAEVREQCKEFLIKELNINPLLPMYDGYIDACVKYASQFQEPSTQGGEEDIKNLRLSVESLKVQLRESEKRYNQAIDRNIDKRERIQVLEEALKLIRHKTYSRDTDDSILYEIDSVLTEAGFPYQSED